MGLVMGDIDELVDLLLGGLLRVHDRVGHRLENLRGGNPD